MKYLFTAVVFVVMFLAADGFCEDTKGGGKNAAAATEAGVCPVCGLKHIDTGDEEGMPEDPYYGVNEASENPERWQSYDENTGLPDVAPSDSEWYQG